MHARELCTPEALWRACTPRSFWPCGAGKPGACYLALSPLLAGMTTAAPLMTTEHGNLLLLSVPLAPAAGAQRGGAGQRPSGAQRLHSAGAFPKWPVLTAALWPDSRPAAQAPQCKCCVCESRASYRTEPLRFPDSGPQCSVLLIPMVLAGSSGQGLSCYP